MFNSYILLIPLAFISGMFLYAISPHTQIIQTAPPAITINITPTIIPPSPTLKPTPKPVSLSDLNAISGPCVKLPVLMYHHIENLTTAKAAGHLSLAVSPENFQNQLQYLADHGYHPIKPIELLNFFDHLSPLPSKPVMLTFDDGYLDFYQNAFPLLRSKNFPALLFLPTGLADNPGYISWNQAVEMSSSGLINIGNHTWSHKNLKSDAKADLMEISTADTQLKNHGLNVPKIFAYPYGIVGNYAQKDLENLSYSLAFTTKAGVFMCAKNKLQLPRTRVGNSTLNSYGL